MCGLLDAGSFLFLLVIILIALMLWRWRVHKDPLPARARTVFNRTFRRRQDADNELYIAGVQQAHPAVIYLFSSLLYSAIYE